MASTIVVPNIDNISNFPPAAAAAIVALASAAQADINALQAGGGKTVAVALTAGTTRTQNGALALTAEMNRVDTSTAPSTGTTLGDGVKLPAAVAGLEVIVLNNTANLIQLYGAGADTINGVTNTVGVPLAPGEVAILVAAAAGGWLFGAGMGSAGGLSNEVAADAVSAAGTTQGGATQLVAQINNITTVGAGSGVNLPASAPGLSITIENNGVNPLLVYPFKGATDTINGVAATSGVSLHPGTVGVFNCTATGAWFVEPASPVMAVLNFVTSADSNMVLTAAQVTGAVACVDAQVKNGVSVTAGRNLQLPLVSALVAALHAPTVGTSYRLRICNFQGGNFALTLVTNTGWTLTGTTFTIAQNTWREFVVTLTSLTTATIQPVAVGTFS